MARLADASSDFIPHVTGAHQSAHDAARTYKWTLDFRPVASGGLGPLPSGDNVLLMTLTEAYRIVRRTTCVRTVSSTAGTLAVGSGGTANLTNSQTNYDGGASAIVAAGELTAVAASAAVTGAIIDIYVTIEPLN